MASCGNLKGKAKKQCLAAKRKSQGSRSGARKGGHSITTSGYTQTGGANRSGNTSGGGGAGGGGL